MAKKKSGGISACLIFFAMLCAIGAIVATLGDALLKEVGSTKISITTFIDLATKNETKFPASISAFALGLGAILMFFLALVSKLTGSKLGGLALFIGILAAIAAAVLFFFTKETYATAVCNGNKTAADLLKNQLKLGVGAIIPGVLSGVSALSGLLAGIVRK